MNLNGKIMRGSGVLFLVWALCTGSQIAWRLAFAWCSLWAILFFLLLYWSANLSCSVELRPQGSKSEEDFEITYIFANNGLLPIPHCQISVHLEKELGSLAFEGESTGFSISEIKVFRKVFQCPRRGVYSVGGATVIVWDPLGVTHRIEQFNKQVTLEIFPHKYPVESLLISGREEGGGVRCNWTAEQDYASIRRIREVLPQESVRHVHWKASARSEELLTREYETRQRLGITILLDSCAENYAGDDDGRIEERCVEVAAGLISHWLGKGYSVEVVAGGDIVKLNGVPCMEAAMRALMLFRPERHEGLFQTVESLMKGRRGASVLQVITPKIDVSEGISIQRSSGVKLSVFLVGDQNRVISEELQIVEITV